MLPINNSDTAWLITTDYLQDNDLHYLDLREDIYCPSINDWGHEFKDNFELDGIGVNSVGGVVGGCGSLVGFESIGFERSGGIIGDTQGQWVGGHY